MALYDGFFDAHQDEETGEYDRDYSSGDFTQYFGQIIGSGVCIHNAPDSFKVRPEDGAAVVGPGYLFIRGHWLKNDGDYTIPLEGTGTIAIAAVLNMGKKMIELEARNVAQAYPDALVLALVNMETGAVTDTRRDTAICGVIDSFGEMAKKVEWATNYIDTEIETKLQQVESAVNVQIVKLEEKTREVGEVVNNIALPPVGTIKFSAASDMGEEWLRCDGSYINEKDYPELVEALRGLRSNNLQSGVLSSVFVSGTTDIGTIWRDYFWLLSRKDRTLFRISLSNGTVKEIEASLPSDMSNDKKYQLSFAEFDGKTILYILDDIASYLFDYFYVDNFLVDTDSISIQKASVQSEPPTTKRYPSTQLTNIMLLGGYYSNVFDYRPVLVFDNIPYVALGIKCFSNVKYDSYTDGKLSVFATFLVIASLVVGQEKTYFYQIKENFVEGVDQRVNYDFLTKMFPKSEYYYMQSGVPYSNETGSLLVNTPSLITIKGTSTQVVGRFSDWPFSKSEKGDDPVFSDDYVLIKWKSVVNDYGVLNPGLNIRAFRLSDMSSVDLKITEKEIPGLGFEKFLHGSMYLKDFDIWVFSTENGIVFSKNISDINQYIFVDFGDLFGDIYDNLGAPIMEYDSVRKRLMFLIPLSNYRNKLVYVELPENFNPISGINLPEISMGTIPGYIKAKEEVL